MRCAATNHYKPAPTLILVSALLALILLVGCASVAGQHTHIPLRSVTPAPGASIHAATLGGTVADFQARYQAVAGAQNLVYDATIAGQQVEIILGPDLASQSRDGAPHIAVVTVEAPASALAVEHWSAATAAQVAQPFLPADARFQSAKTVNGAADQIYTSASVAATFTADQFVTDANAPVPVGTFDDLCLPMPLSNTGLEQCTLAIGSN